MSPPPPVSAGGPRPWAPAVVLAFSAACLAGYTRFVPPWENPDEVQHVERAIRTRAGEWNPPLFRSPEERRARDLPVYAYYPPLYYAAAATYVDPGVEPPSRHIRWQPTGARGFVAEHPGSPADAALQTLLLRLRVFSALCALLSLALVARAAPSSGASAGTAGGWTAAALLAGVPQWMSVGTWANPESLTLLFSTAAFAAVGRLWTAEAWRLRDVAAPALLSGLAMLTKTMALSWAAILPAAILLAPTGQGRPARWRLIGMAWLLQGIVFAPWVVRNAWFYGDPLGSACARSTWNPEWIVERHDPAWLSAALKNLAITGWAALGQLSVHWPAPLYGIPAILFASAVAGWFRRKAAMPVRGGAVSDLRRRRWFMWCTAILLLHGALVGAYLLQVRSAQGRYLFLAAPAAAHLIVEGWSRLTGPGRGGWLGTVVGGLWVLQIYTLLACVRPAYD